MSESKAGRILVSLLFLVGGVGALVSGEAVYTRLLYLSLLIVLVSLLWTRLSLAGLQAHRRARLLKASVGDVFEEHFEIVNASRFLAPNVEVVNASTLPGAAGSRLLTRLGGRQSATYTARTYLTRRGRFPLGPTTLVSGDPFGLFRASRHFPPGESLTVLPLIHPISAFPAAPGLLPGGQAIRRKSAEITPHAAGVRDYAPGDPLKRIHWPATARRGRLMVKEFEQDPQAEVWLFLDVKFGVHYAQPYAPPVVKVGDLLYARRPKYSLPPSTLEYAVSAAASLAHYFIGRKRPVGLLAAAGRALAILPAERGGRQEAKILETLAFLEDDGGLSLAALISMQAPLLPTGSTAILITPAARPELLAAAEDLQRRGLHPVVVLLDAQTFGGPPGAENMEKALAVRGLPVCRVRNGDDLAQTLSAFAAAQGVSTWQRIPLTQLI